MGAISNTKRLDAILADIQERGTFAGIRRYKYDLNFEEEMSIIRAIGKQRSPRFVIDEQCKAAYENILKWCIGDSSAMAMHPETKQMISADLKAGWWIAGNPGTGKSWCLDIISAYCLANHFRCDFGKNIGQLTWCNFHADELIDKFTANGQCEVKNNDIIGIQDVGTERREAIFMGNRIQLIGTMLETRGDRSDKLTMVTSNFPMNHNTIREIYGDRVQSRLMQMFNYIEIKGVDRRKK